MSDEPEMLYQARYSFAAERAPRENGGYAVLFDGGKTDLVKQSGRLRALVPITEGATLSSRGKG